MASLDHGNWRTGKSDLDNAQKLTLSEALASAARVLRAAEQLCILTGAGISAESGIPTFRDALTGLWSRYRAEELATPEAFARQPQVVWDWYAMRRDLVRAASPNAGHRALAAIEQRVPHCTLITQNVDDLHQRAGSRSIVPLHGSLLHITCARGCVGSFSTWAPVDGEAVPRCLNCGALMRPDVVWFGESLPVAALQQARDATFACDVFLSVGTSNLVEPAASLPWLASSHGATVIVVNPSMQGQRLGPSVVPLEGRAGTLLPRLAALAFAGRRARARSD